MEKLYSNGSELIPGTHVTVRQILIGARNLIEQEFNSALCPAINSSFCVHGIYIGQNSISDYIDKFTHENAVTYASASPIGRYWWHYKDKDSRLKFLDWLLTQYK